MEIGDAETILCRYTYLVDLHLQVTTQETSSGSISLAVNVLVVIVVIAMNFVTVWTRRSKHKARTHVY